MQVEQRLLKYVSYWTTSDENNMTDGKIQIPSTGRQFDLGKVLEQELRDLGLKCGSDRPLLCIRSASGDCRL